MDDKANIVQCTMYITFMNFNNGYLHKCEGGN